jgi:hypothetical protein
MTFTQKCDAIEKYVEGVTGLSLLDGPHQAIGALTVMVVSALESEYSAERYRSLFLQPQIGDSMNSDHSENLKA